MLKSPSHAVVGCSDLGRTEEFLALFGLERTAAAELPAAAAGALYGLEAAAREVLLATPGAELGWLRLVATPHPERRVAPLDSRPFAIDFYTTDIERSVAAASQAGAHTSPIVTHQFGPLSIREVEVRGPDHLIVTLLGLDVRRPSLLDREPDRLHSELHSFVWSVEDIDRLLPFWSGQAGLETTTDATFESAELGVLLGVEGPGRARPVKARLVVLADTEAQPARLEMIEFLAARRPGEEAAGYLTLPLAAGLHAPAFTVPDLEAAMAPLAGARFGDVVEVDSAVHPGGRGVTAVAPGDLRFELWQEIPPQSLLS